MKLLLQMLEEVVAPQKMCSVFPSEPGRQEGPSQAAPRGLRSEDTGWPAVSGGLGAWGACPRGLSSAGC